MIHVLTTDRRARSQLSLILHDLGEQPVFADSIAALADSLQSKNGATAALVDNTMAHDTAALQTLKTEHHELKIIGFESYQPGTTPARYPHSELLDSSILLPAHAERAKARLKNTLRQFRSAVAPTRTGLTRPPIAFKRPASKFAAKVATYKRTPKADNNHEVEARYLTAESEAGISFLELLSKQNPDDTFCILNGQDGVEFELAARELNFQHNNDRTPLHVIQNGELSLDLLEKVERESARKRGRINCYIGRTDDLDEQSAIELSLFIEYLENLRNPHMRIILAHANGSEPFFKEGSSEPLKTILKKRSPLTIPALSERAEDIAPICRTMLAALRTAHPFLLVYSISNEAIDYLINESSQLSFSKLIRVLRNSIGLSQRNSLCVEDLKNYGESDTTTQHLLESMADEGFFPQSEAANS
ncbi:MAG: hypothetical protein ACPGKS_07010 [Coraliomargarita sp.]